MHKRAGPGILLGVPLPAQKSSQFWTLMLRADEVALDEAIDSKALGAMWESRGPGRRGTPTYHESMVEALDAGGGIQAILRLAGPEGSYGAIVQYENGRRPQAESKELRPGRIAYTWSPSSTDPSESIAFQSMADAAFRAARSVTKPHVISHDGKPVRGYRIGAHAACWYLEDPWPNRILRDMSTVATYRLKSENLD